MSEPIVRENMFVLYHGLVVDCIRAEPGMTCAKARELLISGEHPSRSAKHKDEIKVTRTAQAKRFRPDYLRFLLNSGIVCVDDRKVS